MTDCNGDDPNAAPPEAPPLSDGGFTQSATAFGDFGLRLAEIVTLNGAFMAAAVSRLAQELDATAVALSFICLSLTVAQAMHCSRIASAVAKHYPREGSSKSARAVTWAITLTLVLGLSGLANLAVLDIGSQLLFQD